MGVGWVVALALACVVVRQWWAYAAAAALTAGILLGFFAQTSIPEYPAGTSVPLSVRLAQAPRISHGQWGDSWYVTGAVIAGGPAAQVTLSGTSPEPLAPGDVVTGRMRVAEPTRRGQAASLWLSGTPVVKQAQGPAVAVRQRMRQVASDDDPGWLLSGMTLGMDQGLSEQARAAMQYSGLTHLTAVSGANCALLLGLIWWVGGWLRLPRLPRAVVSAVGLLAFVIVVGPEPSVLRAASMAGLALAAGLVGGRKAAAHLLQVAVVLLLLVDPWLAFSVGFMLSIAACGGLILLLERGPLAATVAAQIATLPILLAIGASVGMQSVLANVLVTPLVAVIPVLGLTSLVFAPAAGVGRWLCGLVLHVAEWDVFGPMTWLPGTSGVVLAVAVSGAVLLLGRRRIVLTALLLVGGVSMTVRFADTWPPPGWWLVACDVGQGDGFVLRDGQATVVVDTGPDPHLMDQCLDRLGVDSISLLVLTHFHADHVGGVDGVVRGRSVGQVWVSPCQEPPDTYEQALPDLAGLPVAVPTPGTTAQVGQLRLEVIWPQRIISSGSVPNNASVSFHLSGPRGTVAFLGDIEEEAQASILSAGSPLRADVVKVPHHGSSGFDPDLPAAVAPRIALIGVGENSFGHPTPEAISAWQAVGATVYTTLENGDVALTEAGVVTRGQR